MIFTVFSAVEEILALQYQYNEDLANKLKDKLVKYRDKASFVHESRDYLLPFLKVATTGQTHCREKSAHNEEVSIKEVS